MSTDKEKNTAIVAISRRGAELGRRLRDLLPQSELYLPERLAGGQLEQTFALPASHLIKDLFGRYHHLVLVMALGIAVRLIAPCVTDKHQDPGVVVLDDSGKFAVSLLSGHIGGANELARRVASLIGAQPVVTTASENRGTLSPDLLGETFRWEIEQGSALTWVSAALVNDEPVGVYQDAGETDWSPDELSPNIHIFTGIEALKQSDCRAAIIITDKLIHNTELSVPTVIYRPQSLVVGIGCNRGTGCAEIKEAVARVFAEYGLSTKCIRNLATIDVKKNESGLLQFAAESRLPIEYFNKESLRDVHFPSVPSAIALKHVGTPAVCEAAAILSSCSAITVPKTSFNRRITLAVARLSPTNKRQRGKLYLIGIGPGDVEQMTLRARQAIAESEAVVGYHTYVDQIKSLIYGKEIIATGMGREVERVSRAVELVNQGKTVCLISGGDSGMYGLAGLVGEVFHARDLKIAVEVIPGVPSVVAAGALLGAPLNVDVASISLSDRLLPWEEIAQRLHMASQGDFVIALYNPRSHSRQHQLEDAREIILRYRPSSTPVGIVSQAYRPEQSVTVTDLEHMLGHEINMNTIVIIGNSTTFIFDNWMVTPRGYNTKYSLEAK